MRAIHDHRRPVRRIFGALAVVVATTLVTAAPVGAAAGDTKSKTPLTAYKRFAFEFEVVVSTDERATGLKISTEGVYVRPRAQDCEARISFGPGLELSERVVVIGNTTWVDEGDGLKKDPHANFEFEDQCASSPKFWDGFPFDDFPRQARGTTETRDGVAVERLDLTEVFDSVFTSGIIGTVPSDVMAERAVIWRAKRSGYVVGLDLALRGSSAETCREVLELDADDVAPSTCTMTVRFDLSRFDDPKLQVRAGGSKQHVNRT
jgi:hypothetical protein